MNTQIEKKNTFCIYEGSYMFDSVDTTLNISPDFAEMKLAKAIEYRESDKYWASIRIGDIERRYKIIDDVFTETMVIDWSEIE